MKKMSLVLFCITIVLQAVLTLQAGAQNKNKVDEKTNWMVRLAKIEVDTAWLPQYKAAIEEHTKAALKQEPGVLTLFAMYEKAHPERVTVLEIYASKEAYQLHIKTAHFLKYKTGTAHMVKSLELIDVEPIEFLSKANLFTSQ